MRWQSNCRPFTVKKSQADTTTLDTKSMTTETTISFNSTLGNWRFRNLVWRHSLVPRWRIVKKVNIKPVRIVQEKQAVKSFTTRKWQRWTWSETWYATVTTRQSWSLWGGVTCSRNVSSPKEEKKSTNHSCLYESFVVLSRRMSSCDKQLWVVWTRWGNLPQIQMISGLIEAYCGRCHRCHRKISHLLLRNDMA